MIHDCYDSYICSGYQHRIKLYLVNAVQNNKNLDLSGLFQLYTILSSPILWRGLYNKSLKLHWALWKNFFFVFVFCWFSYPTRQLIELTDSSTWSKHFPNKASLPYNQCSKQTQSSHSSKFSQKNFPSESAVVEIIASCIR